MSLEFTFWSSGLGHFWYVQNWHGLQWRVRDLPPTDHAKSKPDVAGSLGAGYVSRSLRHQSRFLQSRFCFSWNHPACSSSSWQHLSWSFPSSLTPGCSGLGSPVDSLSGVVRPATGHPSDDCSSVGHWPFCRQSQCYFSGLALFPAANYLIAICVCEASCRVATSSAKSLVVSSKMTRHVGSQQHMQRCCKRTLRNRNKVD